VNALPPARPGLAAAAAARIFLARIRNGRLLFPLVSSLTSKICREQPFRVSGKREGERDCSPSRSPADLVALHTDTQQSVPSRYYSFESTCAGRIVASSLALQISSRSTNLLVAISLSIISISVSRDIVPPVCSSLFLSLPVVDLCRPIMSGTGAHRARSGVAMEFLPV
jgi:hypothetical protein